MNEQYSITGGVYLVLDPAMEWAKLSGKLADALHGGIAVAQIWNNWRAGANKFELINAICKLCVPFRVPVLINEEWALMREIPLLSGVHFDDIPKDYTEIKRIIGRPFLTGITCSGNLDNVRWAEINRLSYVSFCAMFSSSSAGHCSIVMPATVRQARKLTNITFFVSGGITPQNIIVLKKETPFEGVAVISGILSAEYPDQKVKQYQEALKKEDYEIKND